MPSTEIATAQFQNGKIDLISLLVICGLCSSNGEARRLIQQGGVTLNDKRVVDIDTQLEQDSLVGEGVIIKKGKKSFHRVYTS